MKEAIQILNETLSERKAANPAYSLRAFARDLGLSAPQLSNVINGHRGLSARMAADVARALSLDERQTEVFTASLKARFSPSKTERALAAARLSHHRAEGVRRNLELDLFRAVSSWHHFGILELIKIAGKRATKVEWFARKLGIPEIEVRLALGRLERLELISRDGSRWVVNQESVIAEQAIPTDAVKKFHRQILDKAGEALAFQGPEQRYGVSHLLPVRVKNLDRARKLIQKFRLDFAKEISEPEGGDEIYGLSLQFFQLTQTETQAEESKNETYNE